MKRTSSKALNLVFVGIFVISSILGSSGTWPIPTALADAGSDLVVDVNEPVYLDASGSSGVGDLEYTWYLRDGTVTSVNYPNMTHTFTKEGIYEIGLMVKDQNGYYDLDTVQIMVKNYLPNADAGTDITASEDEIISLNGFLSNDVNDDIVLYEWDFGNGETAAGITASKSYENAGVYYVELTVTDNDGAYDKDTITITVLNVKPTADAEADYEPDTITIYEDDNVGFNASQSTDTPSDVPTLKYSWDFGDGSSGYGETATHEYTKEGTYTATLTVADDNDDADSDTVIINVQNAPPAANSGEDQVVNEGSSLFFDGSETSDTPSDEPLLQFQWDFETDGTYDDIGWYSKQTWWDDGNKQTTLAVEDDDSVKNSDASSVTIKNVAPEPSIFNYTVEDYTTVDFGLRMAGEKWHDVQMWLYENSTEIAYRQIFRNPGSPNDQMAFIYNVTINRFTNYEAKIIYTPEDDPVNGQLQGANPCWLILYLEDGNEFRFHRAFNYNKPDQWEWVIDLSSIVKVTFDAEIYDPGMDTVTFNWNFGDLQPILSHTYPNSGTYPTKIADSEIHIYVLPVTYIITLNGKDDDGGQNIYSLELVNSPDAVTVDNLAPRAFSTVDKTEAAEDELFEFTGSAVDLFGNNLTYYWYFDDGSSAAGEIVSHAYNDKGTYLVTLTVSDSLGASQIAYLFVRVINADPTADAGYNQSVFEDAQVDFHSTSWDTNSDLYLLSYAWDFGDGSKGCGSSEAHVYTRAGIYTVTLTVSDNNGAFVTDTMTVEVSNPIPYNPVIDASKFALEDQLILFAASASDNPSDEPQLAYSWDFGDGITGEGRGPTHSYPFPGIYTVELTVTDDDLGEAVSEIEISVQNVDPVALTGSTFIELYGPEVTWEFEGKGFDSFSDRSSLIYSWDLGGGIIETTEDVSVTFSETGIYNISFEVTDAHLSKSVIQTLRIDFTLDTDGDMITDEKELVLGTSPVFWDSDGDNLLDFWEAYSFPTDPLVDDTDSDLLNDWHEITHFGLTDPDEDGLENPVDWDSDGEWIMDGMDTHPLQYNDVDGTPIFWDTIKVNNDLGISVVTYGGACTSKPTITETFPSIPLYGNFGLYFEVGSTCTPPFDAQIRVRYDPLSLPLGIKESNLVLYKWSPSSNMWIIVKDTGADTTYDFVWGKVMEFGLFGVADGLLGDSDGDGLNDSYENSKEYKNTYYANSISLPYSGGTPLYMKNDRVQIEIPSFVIMGIPGYYFGTVDLFGLGFVTDDFSHSNLWMLTNSIGIPYVWVQTKELYDVQSAFCTFYFLGAMNVMIIETFSRTDPYNPDTDNDNLIDGIEVEYRTDPTNSDTDWDGVLDGYDYDPLMNLNITVHIKEILQHDWVDIWPFQNGDFYFKVCINGWWWEQPPQGDFKDLAREAPNLYISKDIPDDSRYVDIEIQLWDDDIEGFPIYDAHDLMDISRGGRSLDITYDLVTGLWSGEDSVNDRNGIGHSSGNEDGSYGFDDADCDIWFDIYQNDHDGDRLPFWQEVTREYQAEFTNQNLFEIYTDTGSEYTYVPIFIKNKWMTVEISVNIVDRGGETVYYGNEELFSYGISGYDFEVSTTWELITGNNNVLCTITTPAMDDVTSAVLYFEFVTNSTYCFMSIDLERDSDPGHTYLGGNLFIKKNGVQYQIPKGDVQSKDRGTITIHYATVDLFELGFDEGDLSVPAWWQITDGGSRVYGLLLTPAVGGLKSAVLDFKLVYNSTSYHMNIDIQCGHTDPTVPDLDSDGDNMPDWWELRYGFNRIDPFDAEEDSDSDHLTNLEEWGWETDPKFFEINLVVSIKWDASATYMSQMASGMRSASDYLYGATDGHLYFRKVVVYDKKKHWKDADIQVHPGNAWLGIEPNWPKAAIAGFDKPRTGINYITMPQTLISSDPSLPMWYNTIIHECGHYIMRLWDEYMDADGIEYPPTLGPHTLMENPVLYPDLSTQATYDSWWWKPFWMKETYHEFQEDEPCWKTFFDNFKNRVWFDLDRDGVKDTSFLNSYNAISGPGTMVHGIYTKVNTVNYL